MRRLIVLIGLLSIGYAAITKHVIYDFTDEDSFKSNWHETGFKYFINQVNEFANPLVVVEGDTFYRKGVGQTFYNGGKY